MKIILESLEAAHTHTCNLKENKKGITLIVLVITVIILLVLASITILSISGENGLLKKIQKASNESTKSEATEAMNLKITNIQITSYSESGQLPSLQYLADKLCEDNDMQYVKVKSKTTASLTQVNTNGYDSIYTKLKKYPYEFEINSSLQLASIDGITIANTENKAGFVIYLDNEKTNIFPSKESGYAFVKAETNNDTKILFNEDNWDFTISNFSDINTTFTFYFENKINKLVSLANLDKSKYNTLEDILKDNDAIEKILDTNESKEYLLTNNGDNNLFKIFSEKICSDLEKFKLVVDNSAFSNMLEIQKFRTDMYNNYDITENVLAQSQNAIKAMIKSSNFKLSSTTSYGIKIYDDKAFLIGISQTGNNTNQKNIGYFIKRRTKKFFCFE